jgi:glutathione S-transferase
MKLYYFVGACSLADHIVLEWTGAQYETVKMTLQSVKSPEYLALNPNGTVPLLTDGDWVLSQNVAILPYLADLHPEAQLLGDGSLRGRADVMRWLGFLDSDLHPAFKPIYTPTRFLSDPTFAGALAETARANVRTLLRRVDSQFEDREWLADRRSIADPYLFVMLRWVVRLDIGLDGFANLSRFAERMYADPGVHAAIAAEEGAITNRTQHEESYRDASQTLRSVADLRVQHA